jgi:predicted O-methyltransferase YrrM
MYPSVEKVIKNIPRALSDPRRAASLAWRRMFPFGITPKDPEAYRIGSWSFGAAQRVDLRDIFPGIQSADIKVFRSYDRKRDLSLDAQEVLAMCAIASHIKATSIIEVGTSDGNTTLNLVANGTDKARITTLDLPENWEGGFEIHVPEMMKNVTDRARVGIQYRESTYAGQVTQVFGDSAKLDYAKLPGPFDLAFIDGCHFYDYVKVDTQNCQKHMKPGGVIIWHDYGMLEDVSRAVDEWSKETEIVISIVAGTRLAIAKMPQTSKN